MLHKKNNSVFSYFLVTFLFCLIVSCENSSKTFDLLNIKETLIVLNARLVARQSVRVSVGKIWGATAQSPTKSFYDNANVELFEDGEFVGKLLFKDSIYVNPKYIIKPNVSYIIKVSVPNVGNVESLPVHIPADISFSNIKYNTKISYESTWNAIHSPCLITTTIKKTDDVAGYGIDIVGYNEEGRPLKCELDNPEIDKGSILKSPCFFALDLPEVDLYGNIGSFHFDKWAYISKCIDNTKDIKVVANLSSYGFLYMKGIEDLPKNWEANILVFSITAVSNEVLELAKSTKILEGFTAALSEPYPTYSNIKGGLGIVTGYNVSYKILYIQ